MTSTNKPVKTTAVSGADLLDTVVAALTRYVILPSEDAAYAVALWIAATHGITAWAHAARLVIRAPERRCGKSRLLDLVEALSHHALLTVNASPAAVYRSIGTDEPPTLLIDEADTIFGSKAADSNEDLRGLLNAGHQRNRPAIRWDAASQRVEHIATFAMAALAGIGAMPDTIEDRAVVVRMRRRAPGETVAPYRHKRDRPKLADLRYALATWIGANLAELEKAEPVMPLEDRAADTWEPMIAVADLAGGVWPARARRAAVVLNDEKDDNANNSDRIRLLVDCRTAFGAAAALPTTVLIERLRADPEAPWVDYVHGGLTAMRLSGFLREFDIRSDTIRFGDPIGQAKGYRRTDFEDAWARYTPETLNRDSKHNGHPGDVLADESGRGESYQPYQSYQSSSGPVRLETRYGSSRTGKQAVPPSTSTDTTGTAGTATRTRTALRVINGGSQ